MAMMVGGACAQSPDAIDNARSTAKSLQQTQANPAPKAAAIPAANKPTPGAPAPAVKPAAIPGAKPVAAKPAPTSSSNNQLQRVKVVPVADGVQIEISSNQAVTPQVTKLSSPDRVLVELPETVVATAQNKIPVGSAGVKGVRIGMDGKTPPTTSVVVDLEKPLAYELTPGADGKVILMLHGQGGGSKRGEERSSARREDCFCEGCCTGSPAAGCSQSGTGARQARGTCWESRSQAARQGCSGDGQGCRSDRDRTRSGFGQERDC